VLTLNNEAKPFLHLLLQYLHSSAGAWAHVTYITIIEGLVEYYRPRLRSVSVGYQARIKDYRSNR